MDRIAAEQKIGKKAKDARDAWDQRRKNIYKPGVALPPPFLRKPPLDRDMPLPPRRFPSPPRER